MQLTKFQTVMLINAQPLKFIFNAIGGALAVFFLWRQEVGQAIIWGLAFIVPGTIISRFIIRFEPEKIAKTLLGKIFLCYSTGLGLILYLVSHILIPLAFWWQNLTLIFVGLGILLLGLLISKDKYF